METLNDSTIKNFAKAVRAELSDLPRSIVEELTSELEASLAERKLDEGDDFNPGSPITYAAELREAAGVQPKSKSSKIFSSQKFITGLEAWFRRTAFTEAILEFGISIRPLWWVIRATLVWGLFSGFYPNSATDLALLVVLVFLSVQWGRKKWFTNRFFAAILLPLNLIGIAMLLPGSVLISNAWNTALNAQQVMQEWSVDDGLEYNGEAVTELKAFDSTDTEVTGLRFENQNGTPIEFGVPLSELTQYHVPDVIGLSFYDAHKALTDAQVPGVDYVYVDNVGENEAYVVSVSPEPGSAVTSYDTVTVTLDRK